MAGRVIQLYMSEERYGKIEKWKGNMKVTEFINCCIDKTVREQEGWAKSASPEKARQEQNDSLKEQLRLMQDKNTQLVKSIKDKFTQLAKSIEDECAPLET